MARSPVSAATLDATPFEKKLTLRGVTYIFRELSIGEYDDIVKKATTTKKNALDEDIETVDNSLLLRLMVLKCAVSPHLTAVSLNDLPMPVVVKLNKTVNGMHFDDLPEDKASEEETQEADEAAGNA